MHLLLYRYYKTTANATGDCSYQTIGIHTTTIFNQS